jgi:hypothetical protein
MVDEVMVLLDVGTWIGKALASEKALACFGATLAETESQCNP